MTRWIPVAPALAETMQRLREDGASYSEIARRTGVSRDRVLSVVKPGFRENRAAEMRRRRGGGSARAVAAEQRIPPRKIEAMDRKDVEATIETSILDMHARGFRSMGIAASLKSPHRVVYETLVRAGLIATSPATPEEGSPR